MERWHGAALEAIRRADGAILKDPVRVKVEVVSFFIALFQGPRQQTKISGFWPAFSPGFLVADFLAGLPRMAQAERGFLDLPVNVPDQMSAV